MRLLQEGTNSPLPQEMKEFFLEMNISHTHISMWGSADECFWEQDCNRSEAGASQEDGVSTESALGHVRSEGNFRGGEALGTWEICVGRGKKMKF